MSLWGTRLAALAGPVGDKDHGGLLVDVGSQPLVAFTLSSPPFGGPQLTPLGEKRWLWWWVPVARFSTVSAVDGSDFPMFAKEGEGQTALLAGPTSAGSIFLFDEFVLLDGGDAQRRISWSDGNSPPAAYLTAPSPTDDFGSAGHAHTHVGFFKGVGRKNINQYDAVELWSSPFSADPKALTPSLVAKLPVKSITNAWAGGFGRLAFPAFAPPNGKQEIVVWNLQTEKQVSHVLPTDRDVKEIVGVSRDHVYIAAAKPNAGPSAYVVRYPVQ